MASFGTPDSNFNRTDYKDVSCTPPLHFEHECAVSDTGPTRAGLLAREPVGMKRFLIVVCLASAIPASRAVAAGIPWWFHTRPKTVLLDDLPSKPTADARNRAPNHGTGTSPTWGRSNIVDDRRVRQTQPSKSWFTDFLARGRSSPK